jgi:arginase
MRQTIPGHVPVPERSEVLAAARDLEPYQRNRVNQSELNAIPGEIDPVRFNDAIAHLSTLVSRVYLHFDLDSIDSRERKPTDTPPGGPDLERLVDWIRLTDERLSIVAASITAYGPTRDPDDRAVQPARAVARQIAHAPRFQPRPATG